MCKRETPEELLTGGITGWGQLEPICVYVCVWEATGESNELGLATVWTVSLSPVNELIHCICVCQHAYVGVCKGVCTNS